MKLRTIYITPLHDGMKIYAIRCSCQHIFFILTGYVITMYKIKPWFFGKIFDQLKNACMPALFIMGFGYLWSIVLLTLGVSEVHSVGTGPAVGAVLIAAAIIAGIVGAIVTFLSAAIAAGIQQIMSGASGGRPYR